MAPDLIPGVDYEESCCPICGSTDPDMANHKVCMDSFGVWPMDDDELIAFEESADPSKHWALVSGVVLFVMALFMGSLTVDDGSLTLIPIVGFWGFLFASAGLIAAFIIHHLDREGR